MVRPAGHCCDNLNVKKGVWTADEDAKVLAYVSKHGTGNWTSVPKKAVSSAGPKRCGKSCKIRYTNCSRLDLKHESFSPQEEELIVKLHATIGSRWPIIAQQLTGRTDNEVKNYWNTKLKKKLTEMGIDPVTHKPFSQILSDYGNIGYLPKCGNTPRIGSLNRDLKNAFISSISEEHNNPFSTTKSPKTENISEYMTFLNNNNNVQSSNHSSDLLAQLQSINLVTDHAANKKNVELGSSLLRLSPSSSSSSTTCSAKVMAAAQLGCSWQDFLMEDAFSSSPLALDDDSSQNVGINMPQQGNEFMSNVSVEINGYLSHSFEGSSSETSFVEAMLKREDEMMLLEFPTNLLEEPYYY